MLSALFWWETAINTVRVGSLAEEISKLIMSIFRPHSIVCVDACFQQKHNKQIRDPHRAHPNSFFLDEALVEDMERYVDSIRPPRPKALKSTHKSKKPELEEEDHIEYEELKVPRSVLNACNDCFTAAEESREKASTEFFDVTGLMALLCCHDCVLWVMNVKSAGEKQVYVLALLEMIDQHLPRWWTLGLLYDIACQLYRTCLKWKFLERYLPHLRFAISVFHTFGHGWPCQIIFHPRKCIDFGLSDGEGCERFWKALRFLIALLRICRVSCFRLRQLKNC